MSYLDRDRRRNIPRALAANPYVMQGPAPTSTSRGSSYQSDRNGRRRRIPSPSCDKTPSSSNLPCQEKRRVSPTVSDLSTDFRSAIKKAPSIPTPLLKNLGTKEIPTLGKVRVHLREFASHGLPKGEASILTFDKKRRQVTLQEPRGSSESKIGGGGGGGITAPKLFAFDQIFTKEDSQESVVGATLPSILQAVLSGNDGCVLCFGGSQTGKTKTMIGTEDQMGVIPCAISWLYAAIGQLKAKNGIRFSVRVSSLVVDSPGKVVTDVLGQYAEDSETPPGMLLREGSGGLLSSASELRAPSPETASRYLDLALSARDAISSVQHKNGIVGPATLLYSLHIYQYSLEKSSKGGVVGGRSRLHLIDLGDMSGRCPGGLSLSGLNSVLLAVFNGQKYIPHRDNRLSQLLHDVLGSVTCHAAIIVHASPFAKYCQQTLTTLHLASRVHRLRRKKIRGFGSSNGSSGSSESSRRRSSGDDASAGSSSIDFSSSEQSADTVIYIGGGGPGDSTDGEHPPIFLPHHIRRRYPGDLPRLRSLEQLRSHTSSPGVVQSKRPASASPTPTSRSVPLIKSRNPKPKPPIRSHSNGSASEVGSSPTTVQLGFFRHQPGVSKIYPTTAQSPVLSSFKPLEKETKQHATSPLSDNRQVNYNAYSQPNAFVPTFVTGPSRSPQIFYIHNPYSPSQSTQQAECRTDNKLENVTQAISKENNNQINHFQELQPQKLQPEKPTHIKEQSQQQMVSDEQWIDGPRFSKSKVVAARSKTGQSETWIDGPSSVKTIALTYGFMDDHKKTMIEKWVEIQTAQVVSQSNTPTPDTKESEQITLNVTAFDCLKTYTKDLPREVPANEDDHESDDVDTISEDPSAAISTCEQPNFIEELEKKNLIPSGLQNSSQDGENKKREQSSPEVSEEPSIEDICSQCEALAEECEELNSLLSCEEEECKRQIHQGLATVMEEPELESTLGVDEKDDGISLVNHAQTDCDDNDIESDIIAVASNTSYKNRPKITVDSSIQVCQEDILRSLSGTPCPSEVSADLNDDHPLRVLSEENLTCASTFTDSLSQIGETVDELLEDESKTLSLLEMTDYGRICRDIAEAIQSDVTNKNLQDLTSIHDLFRVFAYKASLSCPEKSTSNTENSSVEHTYKQSNPYYTEPIFKSEDTLYNCNKKSEKGNLYRLCSSETDSAYHSSQQTNLCCTDKCIGTEESAHIKPHCIFPTNISNSPVNCLSEELLLNKSDMANSNILADETQAAKTHTYLHNSVPINNYIKHLDVNEIYDKVAFSYEQNLPTELSIIEKHNLDPGLEKSDESDCLSVASEDSEYIIRNSKFSKFLCVGISKSKSKVSIKNKQINKNENKKNFFKIKDSKVKSTAKFKEQNDSREPNSKNLLRSPSQTITPNTDDPIHIRLTNKDESKVKNISYRCSVCHTETPPEKYENDISTSVVSQLNTPKAWTTSTPNSSSSRLPRLAQPPKHSTGTNGSVATTQSLGESSGYESIPRDSECSSFSSSQESEMDDDRKDIKMFSKLAKCRESSPKGSTNSSWLSSGGVGFNLGRDPSVVIHPEASVVKKKKISAVITSQFKYHRS